MSAKLIAGVLVLLCALIVMLLPWASNAPSARVKMLVCIFIRENDIKYVSDPPIPIVVLGRGV